MLRNVGTYAMLVAWAVPMLLVGSILMVGHWVVLPIPPKTPALDRAIGDLAGAADGDWRLVHVLYGQCRCSQRIFEHLLTRPTPAGVSETLLLVGHDDQYAARGRAGAFRVEEIARETLKERFGIESAPLLLIADPGGAVRYAGGYSLQSQGPDYQDLAILEHLRAGGDAAALPAYGCGVSRELQAYLDPIGIKYRR